MEYNVKLPIFEGPFDLLFHLIEKEKIDLNDIPLAKITSGYLEMLETMQKLDIQIAGEFLVMAASLIKLKSQYLLPKADEYDKFLYPNIQNIENEFDIPEIEEPSMYYFESQEDMINKLKEYKVYKELSSILRECEENTSKIAFKQSKIETKTNLLLDDLNINNLAEAFKKIVTSIKIPKIQRIVVEKISVEDKMQQILDKLSKFNSITTTTFFNLINLNLPLADLKYETVITFLAILELSKLQKISIEQSAHFSDIIIKPINLNQEFVA